MDTVSGVLYFVSISVTVITAVLVSSVVGVNVREYLPLLSVVVVSDNDSIVTVTFASLTGVLSLVKVPVTVIFSPIAMSLMSSTVKVVSSLVIFACSLNLLL